MTIKDHIWLAVCVLIVFKIVWDIIMPIVVKRIQDDRAFKQQLLNDNAHIFKAVKRD